MALAQPTGLLVQSLEPLITISQDVERHVETDVLLAENGDVLASESGQELASERLTLISLTQVVDDTATLVPGGTLITLSQEVVKLSDVPGGTLINIQQTVERHVPGGALINLRQLVLTNPQAPEVRTRVTLGGNDVTDITARGLTITATEGDARTARLRLRQLPKGPLDVPSYQGQAVTISRIIGGSLVALFTGTVERPTWDRERRQLVLECSDLRGERLAKEDHGRLQQMTGGLYSDIAQREDASGEQWVRELMKTVPGSLDYTSAGVLRYSPWAVGTPRYTLGASDIHDKEVSLEFATRSEIVNRVPATLEYRYFRRHTLTHSVQVSMRREAGTGLPKLGDIVPTKEAIRSALTGISDWNVIDYSVGSVPADGWYRDTSSAFVERVAWSATDAFRATRGMGGSADLERYISQPQREVYDISVEAPQSIDQFGEIAGSELRVSAETRIDGSVFEERGCTVVVDPDDRRADVDLAIQSIQRQGERQILAAHRKNYAEMIYKGAARDPLPVEIGDPISVDVGEIAATGTVTEFSHAMTEAGDVYTSLKLAVSRVDSSVTVTEDWSLPAQPTQYRLNSDSQALPETPDCPVPTGEAEISGPSRIEPDGTVIITAPSVDRSLVDEIIGTRQHSYPVQIPQDTLTVEVT